MAFSIIALGCSKAGEKAAIDYTKSRCTIPESFVKVKYDIVKDSNDLARLDFKAKNLMGVEHTNRAYFRIDKENAQYINTAEVENPVLDYLESHDPKNFEKGIKSYQNFVEATKDLIFEYKMMSSITDRFDKDSYYDWSSLKRQARKTNITLKRFKDVYGEMPDSLKEYVNKELPDAAKAKDDKYIKVVLNGDVLNWDANSSSTDEFPEQ